MKPDTKAYVALAFVCIVWGTTYLALRIGVMHYPAFLFAGVRQTISGIILAIGALVVNRKKDISLVNIGRQMLIGFLMLTLGNGCVTWGERTVPSGIAAMICAAMPIFAVMFNLFIHKEERFNTLIIAGMLLGLIGVGFIFRQNLADLAKPEYLMGIGAVLLATCTWAAGSIINKKNANPVNAFFNSGLQLLFGGVFMLIISPFVDDYQNMELVNRDGLMALIYLIVFGSILAYAAYMYSLSKLPVGIATVYAYINPLVAVILGYLILGEQLNVYTTLAFVTIVASVFIVNRGYKRQHKTNDNVKPPEAFPMPVAEES